MEKPVLSRISTVMLGVRDLKTSLDFYRGKLGLSVKMQEPQIALLDAGAIMLGLSPGHVPRRPQRRPPRSPGLSLQPPAEDLSACS